MPSVGRGRPSAACSSVAARPSPVRGARCEPVPGMPGVEVGPAAEDAAHGEPRFGRGHLGRERPVAPTGAAVLRRKPMNNATPATRHAADPRSRRSAPRAVLSASCAAAAPLANVHSHRPGTSGLTAAAQVPSLLSKNRAARLRPDRRAQQLALGLRARLDDGVRAVRQQHRAARLLGQLADGAVIDRLRQDEHGRDRPAGQIDARRPPPRTATPCPSRSRRPLPCARAPRG